MKTVLIAIGILLSGLGVYISKAQEIPDGLVELKYEDGVLKEKTDWNQGMVVTRELYHSSGFLMEKHEFPKDVLEKGETKTNKGVLKSFNADGEIASLVPVIQQRELSLPGDKGYKLYMYSTVKGFYDGDTTRLAYKYNLEDYVLLSGERSDSYHKFNVFYNDVFILYKTRAIKGLITKVTLYYPDGKVQSIGDVVDGLRSGKWENFYQNGNKESEGNYKKQGVAIERQVGKWVEYYENGKVKSKRTYYGGGRNQALSMGSPIGLHNYSNRQLSHSVKFSDPNDVNIRHDTIEKYNEAGVLLYKLEPDNKVMLYNFMTRKTDEYKYSSKMTEYYPDGKVKVVGYVSNVPGKAVPEVELNVNPCIMKDNKKVGTWFYFNKEGEITKAVKYNVCGEKAGELTAKEIKKENKAYSKGEPLTFTIGL